MSGLPTTSAFNDGYIAELYDNYRRDPSSVDESWRQFFRFAESLGRADAAPAGGVFDASILRKTAGAVTLAAAIERFGHLAVQIDPLGSRPPGAAELEPQFHGIAESDLADVPASALGRNERGTAADVIQRLRELYCTGLGYEFEHVSDEVERQWLRSTIDAGTVSEPLSADEQKILLERLTAIDGLERFLGRAYVSVKRFSIEGVDALVPMLDEAIARGADAGARHVVLGMAHRGRLNVMTHVMRKPYRELFEEFEGWPVAPAGDWDTGDVKYHMGYTAKVDVPGGGTVNIELMSNPSHLELINPVAQGVARARQRVGGAAPNKRDEALVLPIVVHGDASFAGEGVVAETLNMSLLAGYRVGGSIHIITNNQVGFTTDAIDGRSTHYASDLAKGFEVPIVHVNADDAEACVQSVRLAIAYRQRFNKDFLIDLVGYRRHGHNEADQPAFTQPAMYKLITEHPTARQIYAARLVRERVVSDDDATAADAALGSRLQQIYSEMKHETPPDGRTAGPLDRKSDGAATAKAPETAVRSERLVALNEQLLGWPSTFKLHPTLQRTVPRRRGAINNGTIDWGHAEALAFASLLTDGVSVRITGQDAERGTFSHRQAVLHDVETGETFTPLAHLPQASGEFEIYNSPLSETGVIGFEYGFSIATPNELVLWEAQYGDFANVGQPVFDQMLAAGRSKWRHESGLVLLLPHGYEGQGPEHSSARLERFLQLFAEENMVVAYPSTPAQYFHILRRQAVRRPRRPLVLMQPKSLLRLPAATSKLEDLSGGSFHRVFDDPVASPQRDAVQRLVFCTGKLYYELTAAPPADRPSNVAVIRIEELAPWPREVGDLVDQYPNVDDVVWAQEEPKNMGAWSYVQPRLRASIGTVTTMRYIGRPERSSPAEGHKEDHDHEQARIVRDALAYSPSGRRKAGAAR